jgi:hypothetical protein
MDTKKERHEAAIKKSKMKKAAFIIVGIMLAVAAAGMIIFAVVQNSGSRVYVNGSERVTLYRDGSFVAVLPHSTQIRGTYAEHAGMILFATSTRGNEEGTIDANFLTVPESWASICGHEHSLQFTRK